ncbi:MAG: hypothetical protein LBG97_05725 [Coriobacteriales bacterium]|jgi:hypothetical protein|nr:hypothetical protein [Coriobacteriales bacterium]
MLGKILKYEFKSMARVYALLYAALLLIALVNGLLLPTDSFNSPLGDSYSSAVSIGAQTFLSAVFGATILAYTILVVGTALMPVVISVIRFYKLLGNEGYLWLTLPVSANTHILGKLISSFVWFIASIIVIVISLGIMLIKTNWIASIPSFVGSVFSSGLNMWLILFLLCVVCITSYLSSIMHFFTAIAVGPNIVKSRLGGSVLAYIIGYVIVQSVSAFAGIIGFLLINITLSGFDETQALLAVQQSSSLSALSEVIDVSVLVTLGGSSLLYVVFSVAFYFICHHFMSKKLNLA